MDIARARSLRRGTLSLDEVDHIAEQQVRGEQARLQISRLAQMWRTDPESHTTDLLIHDGDLEIDGDYITDLEQWTELLIVSGDLTVSGRYEDSRDPESVVIVTGNLRAGNLITAGWLEVHGNVEVNQCALFDDNDCCAEVFGDLTAGALIFTDYHHVQAHGRVTAPVVISDFRRIESPHDIEFIEVTDARLADLLVPEVLAVEGDTDGEYGTDWGIDHVKSRTMIDLIRAGRSPILATDNSRP